MIYGKSRNVVVIQNIDSGYVEQAILILKKDLGKQEYFASEEGIVKEAQRIIDNYMQNRIDPQTKQPKGHSVAGLFVVAAVAVIVTVLLLLK